MTGKLAVIGAGLMGSGIAQVAAVAGWQVALRDVDDAALARGTAGIEKSLAKFATRAASRRPTRRRRWNGSPPRLT
jgi:3-hydroxybutyryl-CoA dehydrogenase